MKNIIMHSLTLNKENYKNFEKDFPRSFKLDIDSKVLLINKIIYKIDNSSSSEISKIKAEPEIINLLTKSFCKSFVFDVIRFSDYIEVYYPKEYYDLTNDYVNDNRKKMINLLLINEINKHYFIKSINRTDESVIFKIEDIWMISRQVQKMRVKRYF